MVRRSARGVLAFAGLALIGGCSKPPEPAPTVSWYSEHTDAMKAKVAWCGDDVARRKSDDCQNALAANARQAMGTMKDLPPIDWNASAPKKP